MPCDNEGRETGPTNPYYLVWVSVTDGGELYEYISWITRQHSEYKKIDNSSVGYHDRFAKWLEKKYKTA